MNDLTSLLKSFPLFKEINSSDLPSLLKCMDARMKSYQKEDFIFMSGDAPSLFGVVLSGAVQIIREDYWGKVEILAVLTIGDLFAESFVFSEVKELPVTVRCSQNSEVLLLRPIQFLSVCSSNCPFHRQIVLNLVRIMASKNILLRQKTEILSKRTLREKLLTFLDTQASKVQSSRFSIPLSRSELSDYLACDRSALSRELSSMQREGLIKYQKNRFEILL